MTEPNILREQVTRPGLMSPDGTGLLLAGGGSAAGGPAEAGCSINGPPTGIAAGDEDEDEYEFWDVDFDAEAIAPKQPKGTRRHRGQK